MGVVVMALKRKERWDTVLFHDFLLARAKMPFVWGSNDCSLFCADGIEAITGVDIAADFRGRYADEVGAWATVASVANGKTVEDAAAYCASKFGLVELAHPLMAQRGDLVTIEDGGRVISGLVHLNGRHVVSVGETGLLRLPISEIRRAWHY